MQDQLLRVGQSIRISIEKLGINGEGVGRTNTFAVFIEGALPNEVALVRITELKKTYARGQLLSVEEKSPARTEAACPLFGRCGGCQLMHLSYAEQLVQKRQRVVDALERVGKFFGLEVAPCIPSPSKLSYRNKIQLPVRCGPDGVKLGLFSRRSHDFVAVEGCAIHSPTGEKVFQKMRSELLALAPTDLRHVLIRSSETRGEALVIFVTRSMASSELIRLAQKLVRDVPVIKGVVSNLNPKPGNTILGKDYVTLAGEGAIKETLCNVTFNVSPASFFQVNPRQAENVYQKALELAYLKGDEVVLDAYCGVGTLSLIFAGHVKKVIGVECVEEAIADAKENGRLNGIFNAFFTCQVVEKFIHELPSVDVALLNPPRKGCEKEFLEALVKIGPLRIVYISCDPATLARDLAYLNSCGYTIGDICPFDMFPQTAHVETVVALSKANFSLF